MHPARVLLASAVIAVAPLSAQTTALTHANVVDVATGAVQPNRTITIQGRTITGVAGPSTRIPAGARVTDVRGGFVIPGLWDMHAHVGGTGRSSLALYIANGVTGVRDMGTPPAKIRPWKDSVTAGTLLGPRLLVAGPIIENASWLEVVGRWARQSGDSSLIADLSARIPVSTPKDARAAVDSVRTLGGDFIKIRNDPPPPALFALLRHARQRNIPVAGHWPSRITPAEASDSGFRSLEHGALSTADGRFGPTLERLTPNERTALFAKFARNRTAFTPTLTSLRGFRLLPDSVVARVLADSTGASEPRMRYVERALVTAWRSEFALKAQERPPLDWVAFQKSWLRDLREMADANVLLLAGTDAGSPLVFTGFAVGDELVALVEDAKLTPLQSLQTATLNVAKWMNAERTFGSVAAGRRADLVVLEGNPLEDIRNVGRIRAVVRDGRVLDRPALDALLRNVQLAVRESKPHPVVVDTSYIGTINRAYAALDAQQWADAIPLWERALAVNPYVADHWYGLGRAHYNSGNPRNSIAPFQRALELGGGLGYNAAWNIARAFARESMRDSAMTWLAKSLQLGFRSREVMRGDAEFEKYRNDPEFKVLTDSVDVSRMAPAAGRKHDLELFIYEVRRMHADPDNAMRFAVAEQYIRSLIPRAGELTDNQFAVAIQRAASLLGSGHTGSTPESITAWGGRAVPLQFFDFTDGLRIVAADTTYRDLVGALVTHLGSRDVGGVRAAFDSIISKDHPLGARAAFTRWLRFPQTANGLGILPSGDTLTLTVRTKSGATRLVHVPTSVTGSGYGRFIGRPEWIQAHRAAPGPVPLYLRDRDKPYWFTLVPSERTLYLAWNSTRSAGDEPIDGFMRRMFETADSANADRLVVDLRWNYGGNTALVTPLLRGILARDRFMRRGGLFVIIGRITNSAAQNAVTMLERYAAPVTVGEVSGSRPNFVGEDNFILLPYSKIRVGISDLYWQMSWPQDQRIWTAPLLFTPPTWEAYRVGRDPAMEAISAYPRN